MMETANFTGNIVRLATTDRLHIGDTNETRREGDDVAGSFADMLNSAITKVNDQQVDAERMMRQMAIKPESVDIHQVMIATQKAEIAIGLAKAVRDGALNAYRELINLR